MLGFVRPAEDKSLPRESEQNPKEGIECNFYEQLIYGDRSSPSSKLGKQMQLPALPGDGSLGSKCVPTPAGDIEVIDLSDSESASDTDGATTPVYMSNCDWRTGCDLVDVVARPAESSPNVTSNLLHGSNFGPVRICEKTSHGKILQTKKAGDTLLEDRVAYHVIDIVDTGQCDGGGGGVKNGGVGCEGDIAENYDTARGSSNRVKLKRKYNRASSINRENVQAHREHFPDLDRLQTAGWTHLSIEERGRWGDCDVGLEEQSGSDASIGTNERTKRLKTAGTVPNRGGGRSRSRSRSRGRSARGMPVSGCNENYMHASRERRLRRHEESTDLSPSRTATRGLGAGLEQVNERDGGGTRSGSTLSGAIVADVESGILTEEGSKSPCNCVVPDQRTHLKGRELVEVGPRSCHAAWWCGVCDEWIGCGVPRQEHETATLHLFNRKLTPAINPVMLSEANVGYRMLEKMGWKGRSDGLGLGVTRQGRMHPVPTVLKLDRRGLGAKPPRAPVADVGAMINIGSGMGAGMQPQAVAAALKSLTSNRPRVTHFPSNVEIASQNRAEQQDQASVLSYLPPGLMPRGSGGGDVAPSKRQKQKNGGRSIAVMMQDEAERIRYLGKGVGRRNCTGAGKGGGLTRAGRRARISKQALLDKQVRNELRDDIPEGYESLFL